MVLQMPALLTFGLLVSLTASPLLLALLKWFRFGLWTLVPRLSLWAAAIAVLVIAAVGIGSWPTYLGVAWPTWGGTGGAIVAIAIIFVAMGVHFHIQQRRGKRLQMQSAQYQELLSKPFAYRCFVVATAAVTEEVLYRAYAVGIGQFVLGSLWVACAVSVAAFTLAHFRWGVAHLVPVFVSAVVLTLLFVLTRNLWLCILAHAVVDGAGFLALPAMTRRRAQLGHNAG